MREILVDYARRGLSVKRGDDRQRVPLKEAEKLTLLSANTESETRLELLPLALDRLAKLDKRKNNVVELRYFGGFTVEEIAKLLDMSPSTVEREWRLARDWLKREIAPEADTKLDTLKSTGYDIVLVPNQVVEPFLLSIPSLLNNLPHSRASRTV